MSDFKQIVRIFIPWFLPAYKAGGPVQSIANLMARPLGEEFSYLIVTSNKDVDGVPLDVATGQWDPFNVRTRVWYVQKRMPNALLGEAGEVLFLNGLYSWRFTLLPILRSPARRKILSVRGMLHPGALSQKSLKKKLYLRAWKAFGLYKNVVFHASTEEEKGYVQEVFGKDVKVSVAGNFPRVFEPQPVGEKQRGRLTLVSLALISPMKNILLVLEALKGLEEEICYHIYGAVKDPGYWQQCKALISRLPSNVEVVYHGDVPPPAVEQALASGQVFILPSKSENFGHALYEAMTAGKPVITSCGTPWNGLQEAKAGFNVAAENEVELARAIRTFAAMDAHELEVWSRGAAAYAEAAVDLDAIEAQYRALFGPAESTTDPEKIKTTLPADVADE